MVDQGSHLHHREVVSRKLSSIEQRSLRRQGDGQDSWRRAAQFY